MPQSGAPLEYSYSDIFIKWMRIFFPIMTTDEQYPDKLEEMAERQLYENDLKLSDGHLNPEEEFRLRGMNDFLYDALEGDRMCTYVMLNEEKDGIFIFAEWYSPENGVGKSDVYRLDDPLFGSLERENLGCRLQEILDLGYGISDEVTPVMSPKRELLEMQGYEALPLFPYDKDGGLAI